MFTNLTMVDENGSLVKKINNVQITYYATLDELKANIRQSARKNPEDPYYNVQKLWIKWESENYQEMGEESYARLFSDVMQNITFKSDRTKDSTKVHVKVSTANISPHTTS